MLEETTIIKSKAIFSDDKEHRLLLRKEWNNEKPSAMVIMINPNTADIFLTAVDTAADNFIIIIFL